MTERILRSLADYTEILEQPRVLLFKHSPVCPISSAARAEYESWRAEDPAVQSAFVDVIGERAVARGLAELCGVTHQSPQAILFVAGQPVWNASHDAITAAALAAAYRARD